MMRYIHVILDVTVADSVMLLWRLLLFKFLMEVT